MKTFFIETEYGTFNVKADEVKVNEMDNTRVEVFQYTETATGSRPVGEFSHVKAWYDTACVAEQIVLADRTQ